MADDLRDIVPCVAASKKWKNSLWMKTTKYKATTNEEIRQMFRIDALTINSIVVMFDVVVIDFV